MYSGSCPLTHIHERLIRPHWQNHGISQHLIDRVHEAAHRFFSLPEEVKRECFLGKSKVLPPCAQSADFNIDLTHILQKFHGFSPLFAELSTGIGVQDPAEPSEQACFSEGFDIGYEIEGDATKKPGDPLPPDPFSLYGENQWPREADCPGFRQDFLAYYAAALDLCRQLMGIFAQALDLQADFFDDKMKHPGSMARMMHYPPQPVKTGAMAGLAAHTASQRPLQPQPPYIPG